MAKILKNIDKLVTSTGTEIDFENLPSGGAGATVSAEGLSINKTETSSEVGSVSYTHLTLPTT